MKNTTLILSVIFLASIITFSNCYSEAASNSEPDASSSAETISEKDQVARGSYLVNSMGCDDCHSPKIMGENGPEVNPALRLSGHPATEALPTLKDPQIIQDYVLFNKSSTASIGLWGTSFSANLTPDETGIGNWTEEQFLRSIRDGKSKGMENGRPLLPPMPWPIYRNLTDEDLKAMFAYLKTLKPVRNSVPAPIPPAAG